MFVYLLNFSHVLSIRYCTFVVCNSEDSISTFNFFFILKCLLQFDISSIYVLLKMVQWKECR